MTNGDGQIVNDQKTYTAEHYTKGETEQTLPQNVAVGNWNSNQHFKVGDWEADKFATRFTSIRLVKQKDVCGAITLTYFVEN